MRPLGPAVKPGRSAVRAAAAFLLTVAAFAQNDPTFRAGVALVHVDTEVTSQDGRIVPGMKKEDFRVFENGVEQPVLHCASTEEPLDLILLFDVSGSMRAKVEQVTEAAAQGMRELLEGDRVSVMVFDTRSRVILPFTKNLERVEQAIRHDVLSLKFTGGTMIQSAVDDAAKRFIGQPPSERRRAVLIITDNIGQRTRRESSVVRTFWEADAILSGLIVSDKVFQAVRTMGIIMSPQNLLFQAGMKGIAEKTGGDTVNAPDPGTAFVQAMRRIRTRYSLYYAQPKGQEGITRSIRVELSKEAAERYPKARVRARSGYVSPPMLTAQGN